MNKMIHRISPVVAMACMAFLVGCATGGGSSSISKAHYGTTPDGKAVDIYTLRNSKGAEARIITYGGIVVSLNMPDKNGALGDVVLAATAWRITRGPRPISARSLGATATALARPSSPSMARLTTWPPTTASTLCTAATRALTRWSGTPSLTGARRVRSWF